MTDLNFTGTLQIKDVEESRERMLRVLDGGQPIHVDLSGLAVVDTAGVQLLLAFSREAHRRDIEIRYDGESEALSSALLQLGLAEAFRAPASS